MWFKKYYPSYSIITEENENDCLTQDKTWVLDPIDGTNSFVKRTGQYSIMVSLLENYQSIQAYIYIPLEKKIFFAHKNKGSFSYDFTTKLCKEEKTKANHPPICIGSADRFTEIEKKHLLQSPKFSEKTNF